MEHLLNAKRGEGATLRDLPGVNYVPYLGASGEEANAREISRILVDCGVEFANCEPGRVPWLVAPRPFVLGSELKERLERLGEATFAFFDAAQELYARGDPTIRRHLDANVPPDIRGLENDRKVDTFRMDIILQDGHPKITEVEEIYGNVGKMAALQRGYGVNYGKLFRLFDAIGLSAIYVDDTLPDYISELELLRDEMARAHERDVRIAYFSEFPADEAGVVWRFCKTKDFAQYPLELRQRIADAPCRFVNPLFHGYGSKAALALPFHPKLERTFEDMLGPEMARVVREGFTRSRFLDGRPSAEEVEALVEAHSTSVLKVVDCPDGLDFTWGSRGVYFGDRSAKRWRKAVEAAAEGRIPGHEEYGNATFIVSELVESDRFEVPFLHPSTGALALMTRARIRLAPIFFRDGEGVHLVAGHATFVNTSRKIHLGKHAVCAPLAW